MMMMNDDDDHRDLEEVEGDRKRIVVGAGSQECCGRSDGMSLLC